MTPPIPYNIPEGKSEQEALPNELLQLLDDVFQGITSAFGDNATLYRIDAGKIYESVQDGELVFAGQFVDKSDGEIFNFEINQETNQLGYKSSGEFLDKQSLAAFCGSLSTEEKEDSNEDQSEQEGLKPYNLLLDAINDETSEAGQSPFGSKLRKDLDYLAALAAAMYHGGISIESQPLYACLHSYAIKYALGGLKLFTQSIGSVEGLESELMAEKWVDEHGMDFASAVVKEFSSRRCERMRELIQAGDQTALDEIKAIVEDAIAMAMACTVDLIKTVAEADDYKQGDVQVALAAAIEEYCPIDNSEGYHVSENPRQMASEWQQVTDHSGCSEDLSMQALALPVAEHMSANSEQDSAEKVKDFPTTDDDNAEREDAERIYYVNVGEGPSRNWDDCRQFGFLAAGGGRKWSKQLEKIKIGDTVIAYLKGYGYVGIGKVTSTATPATKFLANGVLIKELPLINDTIRSIKRFSKENGEYLIGVDWQVAVPRDQAAWRANEGLYTTALVCASLRNQAATVSFVFNSLPKSHATMPKANASQDPSNEANWEGCISSLISFLQSYTELIENDKLRTEAARLHALCPSDLLATKQASSAQSLIIEGLNNNLLKICMRLIDAEDEVLALFFIGICTLGDMTDKILGRLLDLIDEGMNLSTLATSFVPHNTFETNALVSLIYWPELPDWARAHLVTRNEIGLTQQDRDGVIEYLGITDNLGTDTLLAISHDIAQEPNKYSSASVNALKAFIGADFEMVSGFNDSDLDDLESHFNELGSYYIAESKKILSLA